MRRVTVVVLLAFLSRAHGNLRLKDHASHHADRLRSSKRKPVTVAVVGSFGSFGVRRSAATDVNVEDSTDRLVERAIDKLASLPFFQRLQEKQQKLEKAGRHKLDMDKLANKMADKIVDKMVNQLQDRVLTARHHHKDLDHSTLAKTHPQQRQKLALPSGFPHPDLSSRFRELRAGSGMPSLGLSKALQLRGGELASDISEIQELKATMETYADKKKADDRETALKRFAELCETRGRALEPHFVTLIPLVFRLHQDKEKKVQEAAKEALEALKGALSPWSCDAVMPIIIEYTDQTFKWMTRWAAVKMISFYAVEAPEQIQYHLHGIFPLMATLMNELTQELASASMQAMQDCCASVDNRDIVDLRQTIIKAIQDPTQTEECISALSATVFVTEVKRGALGMIVPLLKRGFDVKSTAIRRLSAKIVANMAKLVEQPAEAAPFLPYLIPVLQHQDEMMSDPEARTICTRAQMTLNKIKEKGDAKPFKFADTPGLQKVLAEMLPKADVTMTTYCASLCGAAANQRNYDDDVWSDCVKPCMTEVASDDEIKAAIEAVRTKCINELGEEEEEEEQDDAEILCDCEFTLAYGSKIILRKTKMKLKRGYRYGLIGRSEVGKSTLMRAISNGQVDGFPPPDEVRTVFVEADIIGDKSHYTCLDYIMDNEMIQSLNITRQQVKTKLLDIGFSEDQSGVGFANVEDPVCTLSGGWRMKLALSRAMLCEPDIILLDEPTNHLDVLNVRWVQDYLINLKDVTSIMVSHDSKTLNRVCTHILHIFDLKVKLYKGNLTDFVKIHPECSAYFKLSNEILEMHFPDPGYLDGVKSKGRALIKMKDCEWTYPNNTKPTITGVTIQVSLQSRVAILGPNGAGKSTMIKLLVGENIPQKGQVTKFLGCRVAYVAQHAFDHIENHLDKTPNEYIRWRYQIDGEDKEAIKKATLTITNEEDQARKKGISLKIKDEDGHETVLKGVIDKLSGNRRTNRNREFEYEICWTGREDTSWLSISKFKELPSFYMKMLADVDEKVASNPYNAKSLTFKNVEEQLGDVGLDAEYASHSPIGQLSGGQKVKVVFAAALWRKPHVILLDEPTNFLDREALGGLTEAIKEFPGGVVIISHNEEFTSSICTETWLMSKNEETGIAALTPTGADWMSKQLEQAAGAKIDEKEEREKAALEEESKVDAMGNKIETEKRLSSSERKLRLKEINKILQLVEKKKKKDLSEEEVWKLEDEKAKLDEEEEKYEESQRAMKNG